MGREGCVDYMGRGEEEIKMGGLGIELGEMEGVVVKDGDVEDGGVVVGEEGGGDKGVGG